MLIRRGRILLSLALGGGVLGLALPAATSAGWNEPWSGVTSASGGINQSTRDFASTPSLTEIGGVPYVAWLEANPFLRTNHEVRVARLDSSTATWQQPASDADPTYGGINQSTNDFATTPSLAGIGGVPYVAWVEGNPFGGGANAEVRVARLDTPTGQWEQPATDAGPASGGINQSTDHNAAWTSLTEIGGVPYVAWSEFDGTNTEIRVARLNTSTDKWEQPTAGAGPTYGGINESTDHDATTPSLADVAGVPYVAWEEGDATNTEIRVARLNASNEWEQPWFGANDSYGGVNQASDRGAVRPSLTAVGSVPHVAWEENNGVTRQVRVARLNPSTEAWEQPAANASPTYGGITQSADQGGFFPSMGAVGAVPYVAWEEFDGTNYEMRVARFNSSANTWEQPWSGAGATSGGINQSTDQWATRGSLAAVGGVPFVAWQEPDNANSEELRVGRLEPDYLSLAAQPSTNGATLEARARTFGIPYAIGFQYGGALESETTTDTAAVGAEELTVTRQVAGLSPHTTYRYRPFAVAGVPAPKALGPINTFATAGVGPSGGPVADTEAPQTRIRRHPHKRTRQRRATFRFFTTEPGSTFECKLDRRRFKPCKSPKTVKGRPGRHVFAVRARDVAGNVDGSPARFSWTILKPRRAR